MKKISKLDIKYLGWDYKFPFNYLTAFLHPINFFKCLRYPFYKARNVWTGKFLGYNAILYDDIPIGWRKAFGKELSRELKKQLKKDKQLHSFRFTQIKEKWGRLCLYHQGCSEECFNLLNKYEELSWNYCIECGKVATYRTDGYVVPLCKDCLKKVLKITNDKVDDYKKIKVEEIELTDELTDTFQTLLEQNPDNEDAIEIWFENEYFPKFHPNKKCYCVSYIILGNKIKFFYDDNEVGIIW